MMAPMIYYSYERFKEDMLQLAGQCEAYRPDTVIALARGGMTIAHALSMALDIRNLQSIRIESYDGENRREEITIHDKCDLQDSKRVLVVDDIVDSGRTLASVMPMLQCAYPEIEFKSLSIFTKPSALIQPDYSLYEATDWIDFFWERDFLKSDSV